MTSTQRYGEKRFTATMENPDGPSEGNVIHGNEGARQYGFQGALVGGVTIYGWAVPAIIDALGEEWLENGWVDVLFRRPTYPNEERIARVTAIDDNRCEFKVTDLSGETTYMSGEVGLGKAPWFDELAVSKRTTPEPAPEKKAPLSLESAPRGQDLPPITASISKEDAKRLAVERQGDNNPAYSGDNPVVHPAWIASRGAPVFYQNFDFPGPSIHTRSQIQNLALARAGQTFTMACHFVDAFERKDNHFGSVDVSVRGKDGEEVARLRHTSVIKVAKKDR